MLAWIISFALLFAGCRHGDLTLLIPAGLFAIAGNIGMVVHQAKTALSEMAKPSVSNTQTN